MKNWTKKTIVEEYERFNKLKMKKKKKDFNDMMQK